MEDFDPAELLGNPTDPESLAEGGNFRTETELGILDIMQWISGEDRELSYDEVAKEAVHDVACGIPVTVCSLAALMEMKRAAGRPKDLEDVAALAALDT